MQGFDTRPVTAYIPPPRLPYGGQKLGQSYWRVTVLELESLLNTIGSQKRPRGGCITGDAKRWRSEYCCCWISICACFRRASCRVPLRGFSTSAFPNQLDAVQKTDCVQNGFRMHETDERKLRPIVHDLDHNLTFDWTTLKKRK